MALPPLVGLPTDGVDAVVSSASELPDGAGEGASPGAVNVRDTKSYFTAIQDLLDDLTDKAVDQRRVALWCDRYADKVDRMPVLGVDPELLDFGHRVGITLRGLANVSKGGQLNVEMRRTTDAGGIDLLNADLSVLAQSWVGAPGTFGNWDATDPDRVQPGTLGFVGGPAGRVVQHGRGFTLPGARSPFPTERDLAPQAWDAVVDGCVSASHPGCAGQTKRARAATAAR